MRDDQFQMLLLSVVAKAIRTGGSYYFFEQFPINEEITDELDELSSQLFDMVDAHLNARDCGDLELSNEILDEILSNDILRLLSAYYLNPTDLSVKSHEC